MRLVKVGAAVLNQTPMDWEGNGKRILGAIGEARSQGVTILCLPELSLSGYGCEDMFHAGHVSRTCLELLRDILPSTQGMIVSLGLPMLNRNTLFNTVCLAVDGKAAGFAAKKHLAAEGIHYEPRWFKPWPEGKRITVAFDGRKVPFGDVLFDCGGVKIGFEICEDAWAAARPGRAQSALGADLILNPSASHFAFGKHRARTRLVLEGSRAFGVAYLYANLLGNESGRAVYDGGAMIASAGKLAAAGPRFSFRDFHVTSAVIDLDAIAMGRVRCATYRAYLENDEESWVAVPFAFPPREPEHRPLSPAGWEEGPFLKEEEFARALSLALFDYLRKSRARGFVVSLSGGADSAAVACLVSLMVHLGAAEIGLTDFLARLGWPVGERSGRTATGIMSRLLCCVYQRTANSSARTLGAARGLSSALGADFHEFDVQDLVDRYTSMVSEATGRPLTWEKDDLVLQNIQARVRAPGAWMLANLRKAILLATSNRSEAAVGYATMDGDTCGGLSPIAGIDKAFLRQWLRWLEQTGPEGFGPVPALSAVNALEPSAELRPPEAAQTDERDLMPYDLLDAVERLAIRDKLSPVEAFRILKARFPRRTPERIGDWVDRFFRLWARNQWKRERYAPSFHLDDENLDPKTWCRFPILSGGFERELDELGALPADKATEKGA